MDRVFARIGIDKYSDECGWGEAFKKMFTKKLREWGACQQVSCNIDPIGHCAGNNRSVVSAHPVPQCIH